jgi:hypothetical protein
MDYNQRQPDVTMIDDLPDLDQLEQKSMEEKMRARYIRGTHQPDRDSGMNDFIPHKGGYSSMGEYGQPPPPPPPPQQEMQMQHVPQQMYQHLQFNCIDIANHIHDCPICSRFYNNDKTVYIIVIIVLSIVCLLLLKRVLNV